jgi:hypothetical protein
LSEVDNIPASEFLEWRRYDAEEPVCASYVADVAQAHVCNTLANIYGNKTKLWDFILFRPPEPPPTPAQFIAMLKSKGFGSDRKKRKKKVNG